jgi:hypothetical protein
MCKKGPYVGQPTEQRAGEALFGGPEDNFLAAKMAATIAMTACLQFESAG